MEEVKRPKPIMKRWETPESQSIYKAQPSIDQYTISEETDRRIHKATRDFREPADGDDAGRRYTTVLPAFTDPERDYHPERCTGILLTPAESRRSRSSSWPRAPSTFAGPGPWSGSARATRAERTSRRSGRAPWAISRP